MLTGSFRTLWNDSKRFVLIGSLLMLIGIGIGYLQADLVAKLAKQMLEQLQGIVEQVKKSDNPSAMFWMILTNNLTSSVLMMILGVFFAIFPIYGLLANGILLGYLMNQMWQVNLNPFVVFAVGILPHGIFELPAVIFAASMGIRYGVLLMRSIITIWTAEGRVVLKKEWAAGLKQFPLALLTVAVLLVVAAVVESLVTPVLLQNLIGSQMKLMQ